MAPQLAVYASSRVNRFSPVQDSLPDVGQTLLDGLSTRRAPTKGFRSASYITSPFPKLRLARSSSPLIRRVASRADRAGLLPLVL